MLIIIMVRTVTKTEQNEKWKDHQKQSHNTICPIRTSQVEDDRLMSEQKINSIYWSCKVKCRNAPRTKVILYLPHITSYK
jgi:hypothetical protein